MRCEAVSTFVSSAIFAPKSIANRNLEQKTSG
jgi:hypothetical protein